MDYIKIADRKVANVRQNIELLIKYSGVSLPTVSQLIGENERYLTRTLHGKEGRELSLSAVIKIAALFKCKIDFLFSDNVEFGNYFKRDKNSLDEEKVSRLKERIKSVLSEH